MDEFSNFIKGLIKIIYPFLCSSINVLIDGFFLILKIFKNMFFEFFRPISDALSKDEISIGLFTDETNKINLLRTTISLVIIIVIFLYITRNNSYRRQKIWKNTSFIRCWILVTLTISTWQSIHFVKIIIIEIFLFFESSMFKGLSFVIDPEVQTSDKISFFLGLLYLVFIIGGFINRRKK